MSAQPRIGRTLRVVEFAQGVAGPVCGRMFSGLGHEVIKCEPPRGDYLRGDGGADGGLMASGFRVLNAGKRSLVVDLDSVAGVERARRLIAAADVVITDHPPEKIAELGLRGDDRRPGLVVVSFSSFGLGPGDPFVRPDSLLAESFGGLAAMIGEPDRSPLSLGGEQTAYSAGFTGFLGAMVALSEAVGDFVDVALADVAAYIDWKSDVSFDASGVAPRRTGVRFGRWRMLPVVDGWVGIIYQPDQWAAMVELIDDPRLRRPELESEAGRDRLAGEWWAAVEEWARPLTRREVFERAQQAGLAFGMDLDVSDLVAVEQYLSRGFIPTDPVAPLGPFFKSVELGWLTGPVPELDEYAAEDTDESPVPAVTSPASAPRPLEDMVVLDLGTITAGAAAGRLLADYGATVIKIEAPEHPDPFRNWIVAGVDPADLPETSPAFESNNAGKLGVALDLKTATGLATFEALVVRADVVLENFRVGVTERLGIDYAHLRLLKPDLVYLSLSSQGQNGPESRYRSYGSTLDMLSGLASVTGYGDGIPVWSSFDVNYPDQIVSLLGAGLVVHSWLRGIGTHIDLSQRETISWTLADRIELFRSTGLLKPATGNHRPGADPHDVYPVQEPDEWIAVACFSNEQRRALADLIGVGVSEGPALDLAVRAWARTLPRAHALGHLSAAGIPSAPVLRANERADDPHFAGRRVFLDSEARRKGFPMVLDGYTPPEPSLAPALGQDTEAVLAAFATSRAPGDSDAALAADVATAAP
ncbi:CoA transferase [Gryllotalpicola reticulitermitis]|uniref:CoA transferase n=1 Tax=Gryllotalpicola reticulitermitis TaxID=1184153 RepID=A0ABV8Q3F3_9MICO